MDNVLNEELYMVIIDENGEVVYPIDLDEKNFVAKIIKRCIKHSIAYEDSNNKWYTLKRKKVEIKGKKFEIVNLLDVSEFINKIYKFSLDEITNLSTRRTARDLFNNYIQRAYNYHEDFAVLLIDIDGFKHINDTYGHLAGDRVLKSVSTALVNSVRRDSERNTDIVARLGGDEFIIVLKNINEEYAYDRAEQIRREIEGLKVDYCDEDKMYEIDPGTVSLGLYHVPYYVLCSLIEKGYSLDEIRLNLINKCDSVLYVSKNNGKNRITTVSESANRFYN